MMMYIVRHGETDANTKRLFQGWSNDPLNTNGEILAKITGLEMKGIRFDYCISSPLIRSRETARIILNESGNDIPILCDGGLKESNMGGWEHKCLSPISKGIDLEQVKLFFHDTFHFVGCPDGENVQQVCERTQQFINELISRGDQMHSTKLSSRRCVLQRSH